MVKPPVIKNFESSGGVVFRRSDEDVEVALVAVRGRDIWCLPKGIIEKDEDIETTALREVKEETGVEGGILEKIGRISYWYYMNRKTVRARKTVNYFLMKYISGRTEDHDAEVDDARWFPLGNAVDTLKYKGEKDVMQKAKKMIEKRVETVSEINK